MLDKIVLTVGILLYAVVVPVLEINDSHVFNPAWIAHARIHEVWQLITNSSFGLLALWLSWKEAPNKSMASVIALFVTGGFLAAYLLQGQYGGSMIHPDGSEKTLFGTNVGVIGFGWVFVTAIFTLMRAGRSGALPRSTL